MMMAGVNFKRAHVKNILQNNELWDEFFYYISNGETNFIPDTFGLTNAYKYFKDRNKDVAYLNS